MSSTRKWTERNDESNYFEHAEGTQRTSRVILKRPCQQVSICIELNKDLPHSLLPLFLLFGRKPKIPIDLFLPDIVNQEQSRNTFVEKFRPQMSEAYRIERYSKT